jgi:hypothetical protein
MAKWVVIEEFHITVLVSRTLSDAETDVVRQILNARTFQTGLTQAIRDFIANESTLNGVRIRLSR